MDDVRHLTMKELEAGLGHVRNSPDDAGVLKLIVRRPETDQREVLAEGELHPASGLVGDNWKTRGSSSTPDGSANPDMQLNVMNARCAALVAQDDNRWQLAGDQLYIDLDLSEENLPPGHPAGDRRRRHPGVRATPYGLPQIRIPFWRRCDEVRQFTHGKAAPASRSQCERGPAGHRSGGR